MAPPVASAKITLSYPLFASDFDPQNSSFVLVGGGGGEGRTGVGNKIVKFARIKTLVDASRKHAISEVVEIDLSRDEDSVTSLAVASSTDSSVTAFAGINSSEEDQKRGKNEHLRSFRLEYPPRRKSENQESEDGKPRDFRGQTTALGRASLFSPSTADKKETYQRIIRLSKPQQAASRQLGAIATGLAPEGEIVLFDAKTNGPMGPWVEARLPLGKGHEAADVDIRSLEEDNGHMAGSFLAAYCTDFEVHVSRIKLGQKGSLSTHRAYSESGQVANASKSRPKFRSLRFITPSLLLLLQNRPDRKGADLRLLELSASLQGTITLDKGLHKGISAATGLSVSQLPTPSSSNLFQHAIAVAGHDRSVSIFTLEHPSQPPFGSLKIRLHTLLKSVHPSTITSLALSSLKLPSTPQAQTPPQYLKLVSTSVANTVVVHTMPLIPHPPPSKKSPKTRYVLRSPGPSEAAQTAFSVFMSALVIAIGAFLLQAVVEIRGGTPERLGAKGWLSDSMREYIAMPYVLENVKPATIPSSRQVTASVQEAKVKAEAIVSDMGSQQAKKAISSALHGVSDAADKFSSQASPRSSQTTSSSPAASTVPKPNIHIRGLLSRHFHHRHPATDSPAPRMIIRAEEGGDLKAGFHDPQDLLS
ncbi:MAG: hypothetical protein Q9190_006888, partial [Brigantiaea leucoxantha]